jgi:NagD protein
VDERTAERLRGVEHVVLDMDGTIYRGSHVFPFTRPFLRGLTDAGLGYTFVTNNSSLGVREYLEKLQRLGIPCAETHLLTSMHATVYWLRKHRRDLRRLYVLGTPGLRSDLRDAGFGVDADAESDPESVVVGFDTGLCFERLCRAAWWIRQGVPFVATHPDVFCPTDEPTWLVDCGAVTRCLATATGVEPTAVLGKPHESMIRPILERHALAGAQLAVVGDRLATDVRMGQAVGATSVLVLTGDSTASDVDRLGIRPDLVVADLRELGRHLDAARRA